ncbi:MAG: SEC-C metal-binding domain-containing protein [Syntrophobacteraceae bacterium]
MEQNRSASENAAIDPLQPIVELIQGGDPDQICLRYGLSRQQLDKMLKEYQASWRQAAITDAYTVSKTRRNDPCPCGSGKKYKKCCLPRHEEARQMIPPEQLLEMEARAKEKEKIEKEVKKGFELIFSKDYRRASQYAEKQILTYPEDDRFYDILLNSCYPLGDYDTAFRIARKRWQVSLEEKLFHEENGHHKREGVAKDKHVHFYSPSTWLETYWIAQRAATWRDQYPQASSEIAGLVKKLEAANDPERFSAKGKEGFETRRTALAPVIDSIESKGPAAIPYLLPLTYNFTWASLFVPDLLNAYATDECVRLLAELSMFRYPYFSQKCMAHLEEKGKQAIPAISDTLTENPAFDELKVGFLSILGSIPCPESFEILARFTEHENHYIVNWACEALGNHKNPESLPYLQRAKERMGALSKIAGAIQEISELPK